MDNWFDGSITVEEIAIHYYRTGSGSKPPLILLHGFLDNGLCWTRVARDLEADYDLLMVDTRHHGRSGGFLAGYSYDVLANDVASLSRSLDLKPAYLFGHSMGAMTAMVVAATFPTLVRAIVLEDPFLPDVSLDSSEEGSSTEQDLRSLVELRSLTPEERLVRAREVNPGWDEAEILPWAESKAEFDFGLFSSIAGGLSYPWRETLARISCPLLVLTADPQRRAIVTPQRIEEMKQLWQTGETVHINGAGHCIHRDRYETTMDIVRTFLERH